MSAVCRFVLFWGVAASIAGCIPRDETRSSLERKAAQRIHTFLWLHEAAFTNRMRTNLAEIVRELGAQYPGDLHEKFRRFGTEAGFRDSFYDRYLFAPPGVSNTAIHGEVVLVNAEPYLDDNNQPVRIAIVRGGPGYEGWSFHETPEWLIQEIFRQANVPIPQKNSVPGPPKRLASKQADNRAIGEAVQMYFRNLARDWGLGPGSWWMLLLASIILFLAAITLLYFIRNILTRR
ncbi:MAG: hypothetical protein L0Y58_14665 [Verrucomicrobia subdivision 3 bacterium]|nr:hypothetical protein [Limisphaerales bacterium]